MDCVRVLSVIFIGHSNKNVPIPMSPCIAIISHYHRRHGMRQLGNTEPTRLTHYIAIFGVSPAGMCIISDLRIAGQSSRESTAGYNRDIYHSRGRIPWKYLSPRKVVMVLGAYCMGMIISDRIG